MFGAKTSLEIGGTISKWINPERFYVSFPYSVYPPEILRPSRLSISKDINFALTHGEKSFKTNDMLGFTFNKKQMIKIKKLGKLEMKLY